MCLLKVKQSESECILVRVHAHTGSRLGGAGGGAGWARHRALWALAQLTNRTPLPINRTNLWHPEKSKGSSHSAASLPPLHPNGSFCSAVCMKCPLLVPAFIVFTCKCCTPNLLHNVSFNIILDFCEWWSCVSGHPILLIFCLTIEKC